VRFWVEIGPFCAQNRREIAKNRHRFRCIFIDSKDSYSQKSRFEVYKITPFIIWGLKRADGASGLGGGREVRGPNEPRIEPRRRGDPDVLREDAYGLSMRRKAEMIGKLGDCFLASDFRSLRGKCARRGLTEKQGSFDFAQDRLQD
jgi:hypothetical protein